MGGVDLSRQPELNAGCRGFVDEHPNHILNLIEDFDYLRLTIEGTSYTGMVLLDAAGTLVCSASSEPNDASEFASAFPRGPLRIWITSDMPRTGIPYTIQLSERRNE